jgi:hypothetical protein
MTDSARERKCEMDRLWRAANPDKAREAVREASRLWKAANPDKVRETEATWRKANPDRARAFSAAWQARKRAIKAGVSISLDPAIIDFYEFAGTAASAPCVYCGEDPGPGGREVDHKVSFAKGGPHALDNLCVACKTCNSTKRDKTAEEFMALRAAA